jgi:hypothetical protein
MGKDPQVVEVHGNHPTAVTRPELMEDVIHTLRFGQPVYWHASYANYWEFDFCGVLWLSFQNRHTARRNAGSTSIGVSVCGLRLCLLHCLLSRVRAAHSFWRENKNVK